MQNNTADVGNLTVWAGLSSQPVQSDRHSHEQPGPAELINRCEGSKFSISRWKICRWQLSYGEQVRTLVTSSNML